MVQKLWPPSPCLLGKQQHPLPSPQRMPMYTPQRYHFAIAKCLGVRSVHSGNNLFARAHEQHRNYFCTFLTLASVNQHYSHALTVVMGASDLLQPIAHRKEQPTG